MRLFKPLLNRCPRSDGYLSGGEEETPANPVYIGVRGRTRIYGRNTNTATEQLLKYLPKASRLAKFLLVGGSGVLVNMGIYTYVVRLGVAPAYASIASVEASILSNYTLNDLWTFRDRRSGKAIVRLLLFHLSRLAGAATNVVAVALLTGLGAEPITSNAIGIVLGVAVNYYMSDRVVWRVG
jgi:dolichol-phosphate mannosyltransferase